MRKARLSRDDGGAALVEFSLALTFLLTLLVGSVELGKVISQYQTAVESLQASTHYLARMPDPRLAVFQTRARNLALTGTVDGTAPYVISTWTDPNSIVFTIDTIDNSGTPRPFNGGDEILLIRSSTVVPFSSVFLSMIGLETTVRMGIGHEERHIGE